jgi:hypothetical protein
MYWRSSDVFGQPVRLLFRCRFGSIRQLRTRSDLARHLIILLCFELQRITPHAEAASWVAEYAEESRAICIAVTVPTFDELYELVKKGRRVTPISESDCLYAVESPSLKRRVDRVLRTARQAVEVYHKKDKPTLRDRARLTAHALRLASLDVYAARTFFPRTLMK